VTLCRHGHFAKPGTRQKERTLVSMATRLFSARSRARGLLLLAAALSTGCSSEQPLAVGIAQAQTGKYGAPPPLPSPPDAAAQRPPLDLVRRSIQLTILGSFTEEAIAEIEHALRTQLTVEVLPTERRELPRSAYYAPRKRYRAEKLLAALEAKQRGAVGQLGLTEVDISTTKGRIKDWGVFGLGAIGGDSAVISTHRLLRDNPSAELYRFRVVTSAVHEVGHMLGLDHCKEPHCVMNDAEGSIRTVDTSTGELGPTCQKALIKLAPRNRLPTHPPPEG
jgi:archaemetzincin